MNWSVLSFITIHLVAKLQTNFRSRCHTGLFLCSLVQYPNRKDFKLIVPETDVKKAITSSKEFYSNGNIPVFDALDLEITKNGKSGMIAYCKTLKCAENHYKFTNTLKEQDETQTIMKTNSLCIIRLENPDETFATTDLGEPVPLK